MNLLQDVTPFAAGIRQLGDALNQIDVAMVALAHCHRAMDSPRGVSRLQELDGIRRQLVMAYDYYTREL